MALDTGVTCWLMVSAVLVMLMTPGVGLFYGGLVRKKNFISMIALSFVSLALASIHWILIGYSLAFGPDVGGFIGNLNYLGLAGVSADAGTGTYPPLVFMIFQLVLCSGYDHDRHFGHCRADQVLLLYRVLPCLAHARVLPDRPLGMGWRMGTADGTDRFCRGNGS